MQLPGSTLCPVLPARAITTFQIWVSRPGRLASATIGTSGSCGERSVEVTAKARKAPLLTYCAVVVIPSMMVCTIPEIVS